MTKPISTRVHGIIDYTWAAAASSAAARVDGASSTARLLRRAAAAATTSSFFTRYEGGAVRILPMKGHLALDALLCGALAASPWYLPAEERRYAAIPVVLGILGLVAGMLTETRSPVEIDEEFGVFGGGQRSTTADRQPDAAPAPYPGPRVE